jgi:hypothetical protein
VKDFKYLYYQRHLVRGHFALPIPTIFAIKSPVGDGYVYLRRRISALQIRDFDNGFVRSISNNSPIGVKNVPVRGIADGVSMDARPHGRDEAQTWVFTKGDLPRLINEETFTEFLACIPLKDRNDPIVGTYRLIADYYERFIDVYRTVSGDAAVAHFASGRSFVPFTGETMIEIADHVTQTFDEIVVNCDPKNFDHRMLQMDTHYTEKGSANPYQDETGRAELIGHHLASGLKVNLFHKRIADLMGTTQEVRDPTLLVLAAFPVFETFYNGYIAEVRNAVPKFNELIEKKERKARSNFIQIGTKITWLPTAISALGFEASSVSDYYIAIEKANDLRKAVVHDGRQVRADEAAMFIHQLTMCVILCDASLGKAGIYTAPLRRSDDSIP